MEFNKKSKKNPIEDVFDQISDLLRFCYDNANAPVNPELPEEMENKLSMLEKQVQKMEKDADKMIADSGADWNKVNSIIEGKGREKISQKDRDLLERAEALKKEAEAASKDFLFAASKAKAEGNLPGAKKKDKKGARKSKFRRVGGHQDWKPL